MEAFLEYQAKEYCTHATLAKHLHNEVSFQRDIQKHRTIPKKYLPRSFPTVPNNKDSVLTARFKKKYNEIFFEHLEEVIATNTITMELEEARLRSITQHT